MKNDRKMPTVNNPYVNVFSGPEHMIPPTTTLLIGPLQYNNMMNDFRKRLYAISARCEQSKCAAIIRLGPLEPSISSSKGCKLGWLASRVRKLNCKLSQFTVNYPVLST